MRFIKTDLLTLSAQVSSNTFTGKWSYCINSPFLCFFFFFLTYIFILFSIRYRESERLETHTLKVMRTKQRDKGVRGGKSVATALSAALLGGKYSLPRMLYWYFFWYTFEIRLGHSMGNLKVYYCVLFKIERPLCFMCFFFLCVRFSFGKVLQIGRHYGTTLSIYQCYVCHCKGVLY